VQNNTSHTQAVCIAILPFENISAERGHDYLAMGFCEDLITDLAHFHSLQVVMKTAVPYR
jgi:TolB-like protein